jgi:quercetin dioxygenase-like cupin family protein
VAALKDPSMRTATLAALGLLCALYPHPASAETGLIAQGDNAGFTYGPGPASLPKGTRISNLLGDPSKPGPFVLRLIFPAHTDIMPHTHATPETVTILSGTIYHEHGPSLVRARGTRLAEGGFVYLPQGMPHSLWTTDEPATIQVSGTGPFGLHYVNPADDPSRSK